MISKEELHLREVAHELKLKSDDNDLNEEVLLAELMAAFRMGEAHVEEDASHPSWDY